MPLVALGAAVAFGAQAAPAQAIYVPVCATKLVDAGAGATAGCTTNMIGDTNNVSWHMTRTASVEVAAGTARLTLRCHAPWRSWQLSTVVTGPGVDFIGTADDHQCDLTLTALTAGTTATATSTFAATISPK